MKTIEEIRAAFQRVHDYAVNNGPPYMSIPANPNRDADLIVTAAIGELAELRAKVTGLEGVAAAATRERDVARGEAAKLRDALKAARTEFNDQWKTLASHWAPSWREALEKIIDVCDLALGVTQEQQDAKTAYRALAARRRGDQ